MQERQKKYRKFLWYALAGTLLGLFVLIYGTLKENHDANYVEKLKGLTDDTIDALNEEE